MSRRKLPTGVKNAKSNNRFPSARSVEAKAKDLPRNSDGQFSSPELTTWYVREFNTLNKLKP